MREINFPICRHQTAKRTVINLVPVAPNRKDSLVFNLPIDIGVALIQELISLI